MEWLTILLTGVSASIFTSIFTFFVDRLKRREEKSSSRKNSLINLMGLVSDEKISDVYFLLFAGMLDSNNGNELLLEMRRETDKVNNIILDYDYLFDNDIFLKFSNALSTNRKTFKKIESSYFDKDKISLHEFMMETMKNEKLLRRNIKDIILEQIKRLS